jgi:teichoic acid transport system permease protein
MVQSPRDSCPAQLTRQEQGVTDQKTPLRARLAARSANRDPNAGRLSAPGQLQAGQVAVLSTEVDGDPLAELARRHGLRPSAQRPTVVSYLRQLWRRRHFIFAFATARNIAMYTEAKLGQLWQILTPLLNAGVYLLIFGIILGLTKGIPDYPAFLVTGVFVFNFTQRAFISTSTVITDSLPLIRALQFPRASLPLAYVMIELQQMLITMGVLAIILLGLGEPITIYWLLAIPALVLQTAFNVGVGLFVARLGSQVNDFSQLLPFLLRTWMYLSGVLFSISTLLYSHTHALSAKVIALLQINPAALYITLVRLAMIKSQRESQPGYRPYNAAKCDIWQHLPSGTSSHSKLLYYSAYCKPVVNPAHYWPYAIGWAVLALIAGFFFFWRAETRYGRG